MDLNDPRRRLQVLQQSSPSLRVSAAPAPQLKVTQAAPQPLYINTGDQNLNSTTPNQQFVINRTPGAVAGAKAAPPRPVGLASFVKPAEHLATGILDSTVAPFGRGLARLVPGGQNDLKQNEANIRQNEANVKVITDLYRAGKMSKVDYAKNLKNLSQNAMEAGRESTRIADTADRSQVVGSAITTATLPFVGAADAVTGLGAKVLAGSVEGGALGALTELTSEADPTAKGFAVNTGIGAATGGAIPLLGALKNRIFPSAKAAGISKSTLKELKKSNDAGEIFVKLQQEVGGDINELMQAAEKIANSENGRFILKQINNLPKEAGIAAATAAGVSDAVARQKYKNSPLTGESQKTIYEQPQPDIRDFGPQDPVVPNDGNGIKLNSAKTEVDEELVKAQEEALKEAGSQAIEQDLRLSPINHNAKEVVKDPANAKAIVRAADPNNADSMTTVINALAKSPNKAEIRSLIEGLRLPVDGNTKNRLVKDLVNENDPNTVMSRIQKEIADWEASGKPNPLTGEKTPVEPTPNTPQATQEAIEALPAQNGTEAATVAQDAPQASTAADTQVAESVNKNADKSAAEMFPNMSPEDQAVTQKILDAMKPANQAAKQVLKDRKQEKAARIAKAKAAYDAAGGGQAGLRAKKAAMEGKYSESGFTPVQLDDPAKKRILDDIEKGTGLQDYEALNMQTAFEKLWGDNPKKPTEGDVKKIAQYFEAKEPGLGEVVGKMVKDAADEAPDSINVIEQIAGLPRTLMTVADASAPRQLAVSLARHPITTTKAYLKSLPEMFSGKRFNASTEQLANLADANGKNYAEFMDSAMNLHLPNVAERSAEESMSSAPLMIKAAHMNTKGVARKALLPVKFAGKLVEGSNRGMSSAIAHTRFNLAKKFIDDAGGVEEAARLFPEKDLSDLGEVLNTITGRGGKKGGFTEKHATILSNTLFSGKLWASRLNMINPYWYYRLSGPARKEALTSAASFAASAAVILTLIDKMPGVEVGKDRTSADWMKVKVGNTRFDILGGFQQNLRVLSQIQAGKRTSSTDSTNTKEVTPASVFGGLVEGKANPLLGFAWKTANTTDDPESSNPSDRLDKWGEKTNVGKEASKLGVPLPVSGVKETVDDQGGLKGALLSVPGFFGAGVQTYGGTKTKDKAAPNSKGVPTFKGKKTEDMVLDESGQPYLDKNGAPVKVKFNEGASKVEKQAIIDAKKESLMADAYKKSLSTEAQALIKRSDAELNKYLDDGTITQKRFDQILEAKDKITKLGKKDESIIVPKEYTSEPAKKFYKDFHNLDDEGRKAYLRRSPDANAKTIATELNKARSEYLDEFKPSMKLTKLYADYEKALAAPDLTDIDKRNKAKELQIEAYKLNQSEQVKDIFAEGGSADLKNFIANQQIAKADLDAAIKMDDDLYNSGLTGALKFSKKFRKEMGYGLPTGGKVNENLAAKEAGSGSGSKDTTQRAYLDALMPSFKKAEGIEAPSKLNRGIKFKAPTNVRKSGAGQKRVSIKL